MSMEYKETCPEEINAQLPSLGWMMWRRRRVHLCIKVLGFGGLILLGQWRNPNWLLIGGLIALLAIPEIGFLRLIAWTNRAFTRRGANDWVESTSAGGISLYRNGRLAITFPLAGAQWMDVPDLQVLTKYGDFPPIHVFVVARWVRPSWWKKAPMVMCGFTEESREEWRKVFAEAGLEEQRAG